MTELEQLGVVQRDHTSFSQLDTYSSCGQKFYLQRVAKVPQRAAGALIGGRLIHAVIEESERLGWWHDVGNFAQQAYDPTGPPPPEPAALALYNASLDAEVAKAGGVEEIQWSGRDGGEDLQWWRKQGEFMLRRYQVTREAMDVGGWGAIEDQTEMRVETKIPGLSVSIVAYLDKFLMHESGEATIVDWSTGKIGGKTALQFATYAAVILATRGLRVTRGVPVYLRAADAARRVQVIEFAGLVDRIGPMYADMERGIAAGIFSPHPSWLCRSCGVREHCWFWQATEGKAT